MPNPSAVASKSITYTFGAGQAEGIDNVAVYVTASSVNPFTQESGDLTSQIVVQLPANGWDDADVLAALQAALPQFTVAWAA